MTFKQAFEDFIEQSKTAVFTELHSVPEYSILTAKRNSLLTEIKEELPDKKKHLIDDYDEDVMIRVRTMTEDKLYLDGFKNMLRLLIMFLKD